MKQVILLLAALLTGMGSSRAETRTAGASALAPVFSNAFIFVEDGVTFALYPDGEFDFYIDSRLQVNAGVQIGPAAITFNSGFNYNPFVQFDDFGAVIQVENVPVFYDFYGRVSRIGTVGVHYRSGRLYRLGGMRIFYNSWGGYDYHLGFVNPFNRVYAFRPFHRFFMRPAPDFCMVYRHPYRRYYQPVRYTWYQPYHNNLRRAYARVGDNYRYQPRSERSRIYRNDHRVVARQERSGRSAGIQGSELEARTNKTVSRRSSASRQATREYVARTTGKDNRATPVSRSTSGRNAAGNDQSRVARSSQGTSKEAVSRRPAPRQPARVSKASPQRDAVSQRPAPQTNKPAARASRSSRSTPVTARQATPGRSSERGTRTRVSDTNRKERSGRSGSPRQ